MKVKIVLVEPEYQMNIGSVARVLGNFGFSELSIIKPRCDKIFQTCSRNSQKCQIMQKF
jgi:tRNA C32,U32 (ribose-2'-O)-methylase TrmJ